MQIALHVQARQAPVCTSAYKPSCRPISDRACRLVLRAIGRLVEQDLAAGRTHDGFVETPPDWLAAETEYSLRAVRYALRKLEAEGKIEVQYRWRCLHVRLPARATGAPQYRQVLPLEGQPGRPNIGKIAASDADPLLLDPEFAAAASGSPHPDRTAPPDDLEAWRAPLGRWYGRAVRYLREAEAQEAGILARMVADGFLERLADRKVMKPIGYLRDSLRDELALGPPPPEVERKAPTVPARAAQEPAPRPAQGDGALDAEIAERRALEARIARDPAHPEADRWRERVFALCQAAKRRRAARGEAAPARLEHELPRVVPQPPRTPSSPPVQLQAELEALAARLESPGPVHDVAEPAPVSEVPEPEMPEPVFGRARRPVSPGQRALRVRPRRGNPTAAGSPARARPADRAPAPRRPSIDPRAAPPADRAAAARQVPPLGPPSYRGTAARPPAPASLSP